LPDSVEEKEPILEGYKVLTESKRRNYSFAIFEACKQFEEIVKDDLDRQFLQYIKDTSGEEGVKKFTNKQFYKISFDYSLVPYILQEYDKLAYCVKQEMDHSKEEENIDEHKIAAIMLLSLLEYKNLIITEEIFKTDSTILKVPYLFYSFILGAIIIERMHALNFPHETKKEFNIDLQYVKHFAKMIYKNQNVLYEPVDRRNCHETVNLVFILSNLFYLFENIFMKNTSDAI